MLPSNASGNGNHREIANTMKLYHQKLGEGPPLIILHGLFGSSDNWLGIAKVLAEQYTVFLPDQRNHGRSPHSPSFAYADLAGDIREFLEDFSLKRVVLLGHSMGGKTTMKFALDYPLKVDKLIVADIAPKAYPLHHDKTVEALQTLPVTQMQSRKEAEAELLQQIGDMATVKFLLKNLERDESGKFRWRLNVDGICANLQAIGAAVSGYNTFDHPALFIRGSASNYVQDEDWPAIRELFPQAQMKTIEGASHWLHVEQPQEFVKVVQTFLAKR